LLMKRVLMVAFHFPPLAGSSGIQRTLRFAQHLPEFGWQPLVLTASKHAYEQTSSDLDDVLPASTIVRRAFAADAARHLALRGRHIASLARPDRWITWKFDGIRQGMKLIRQFEPDVLWSTYPIATAHVIGSELQRRSGIPWVADFRDPMAQDGYPSDPETWKQYSAIERDAVGRAGWSVFTTPGAAKMYRQRYPKFANRIAVLENGFDEAAFADVGALPSGNVLNPGAITLLHSGIVYPQERDPTQLFVALARLKQRGRLSSPVLKVRFRAAVHEEFVRSLAVEHGLADIVEVLPSVAYKLALREMLSADALLVMQASNCNEQIPAKIYEYLRAGRPIVCLSDQAGDTVEVLRQAGVHGGAALDSAEQIERALEDLLGGNTAHQVPAPAAVARASRRGRTADLVSSFEELIARRRVAVM
jgi:glycosyltransferase involved in cell wall biosynthesis